MSSIEILSVASELPKQKIASKELLNKAESHLSGETLQMLQEMAIDNRYSVVENYVDYLVGKRKRNLLSGVNDLGVHSIEKCINQLTHDANIGLFIAVTNTAERPLPCMAYELVSMLDQSIMPRNINVINMQNQGCSALIKAFELSSYFLQANPKKQVLICVAEAHTAMIPPITHPIHSFHEIKKIQEPFLQQEEMSSLNNLINGYLFGDGAVSLVLGHKKEDNFEFHHLTNLTAEDKEILCMNEGGSNIPCYENFPKYTLGKNVPARGAAYSELLLHQAIKSGNVSMQKEFSHYLVHTGSHKIINAVCKKLHLEEQVSKIAVSYFLLKNYGNLSSCSIGFMLDNLINVEQQRGTTLIISFGVGFSGSVAKFKI